MTSALQKSECCSATSAAQHSENCSATSVFRLWHVAGVGFSGVGFRTCWFCWVTNVLTNDAPKFWDMFCGSERIQKSTEHANREIWPTNSLTKVLMKMHTGVYTKMSTEMPTKVEDFCVKRTTGSPRRLPRECSREIWQCSRKSTRNPVNFLHVLFSHVCFLPKNPAKFLPNFPHHFSVTKSDKKSPTSFCRSAGWAIASRISKRKPFGPNYTYYDTCEHPALLESPGIKSHSQEIGEPQRTCDSWSRATLVGDFFFKECHQNSHDFSKFPVQCPR